MLVRQSLCRRRRFQRTVITTLLVAATSSLTARGFASPSTASTHHFSTTSSTKLMSKFPTTWSNGKAQSLEKCFLPLSSHNHKGSSGRIGVLGGSSQYTGAPFYAGMASLQAGADLAFIFCAEEAALPIKSYSPELMVAPVYKASEFDRAVAMNAAVDNENMNAAASAQLVHDMVNAVASKLERLHVLVLGPGLGRCPLVLQATAKIIEQAKAQNLTLVLDADALYLLTLDEYKNILIDYDKVVLTPNVVEFKRLKEAHGDGMITHGGIIVQKGLEDVIRIDGSDDIELICKEQGGLKRSGGLGDLLAGTIATFLGWNGIMDNSVEKQLSCWTACCVVKRATCKAFESKRRAMTAPDVLDEIGPAMTIMEQVDKS